MADNNLQVAHDGLNGEADKMKNSLPPESNFRANLKHMDLDDQPPSRFSTTTYATTAFESPPSTPEMGSDLPLPTPPSSILNRKRPVPVAGVPNPKTPARKPTPAESVSSEPNTGEQRQFKSLPKSPPEVQAVTRVASLQAKLDDLQRRRGNLKTVIHELTHVVQPSSVVYDKAARQEIKKTVDGLHNELAQVMKEEHETGLKLHRAWKKNDDYGAYECLWVRRVTT